MRRVIRSVTAGMFVLAGLMTASLGQPAAVQAADATVTNCGEASFDAALDAVQNTGGGTITFGCAGTISFTSQKTITSDVTIAGTGVILDGGNSTRLFQVDAGARLALIGLTLRNGRVGGSVNGGAIHNSGTLTITASAFSGNSTAHNGGAIFSSGTLSVTASTFSGNSTTGGVGDGSGGAIYSSGTLTITASTFSGNSTAANGGAIRNEGGALTVTASTFEGNSSLANGGAITNHQGTMEVTASTFYGNSTDAWGGAIDNFDATGSITASTFSGNIAGTLGGAIGNTDTALYVSSSILAGSLSGGNCSELVIALGYNLSDDESCGLGNTGDQQGAGVPINLGSLQDNGGPAETMLPLSGSAAIEAIPGDDCLDYSTSPDQRGVARPDGADCEIGAVELGQVSVKIITTYNLGPAVEGDTVEIVTVAVGPAGAPLTYQFDCDNDGTFEISQLNDPSASCPIPDDGLQAIPVRVTDGATTANDQTTVEGINVAPTIDSITTNGPVPQGQPVKVTVSATDPGVNDVLSYAFDCDDDGVYEVGPQASNTTNCPIHPGQASATINFEVSDDDGGSATGSVVVDQTLTLCGSPYTGAVSGPTAGGACPAGTVQLTLPMAGPATLCINPYTGALLWAPRGSCAANHRVHIVPDDGPLNYCQSLYTGKLRYSATGQCGAGERAGVIPG